MLVMMRDLYKLTAASRDLLAEYLVETRDPHFIKSINLTTQGQSYS